MRKNKGLFLALCLGLAFTMTSCGETYYTHDHKLIHVDEIQATCTNKGVKEHWTCEDCDKIFINEEGTIEVTKDLLEIAALGHDFKEVKYNEETFTYEKICSRDASHKEFFLNAGLTSEYPFLVKDETTFKTVLSKVTKEAKFIELTNDLSLNDIKIKDVVLKGNLEIKGTSTILNSEIDGKLTVYGDTLLSDLDAKDVLVKAGAKVNYYSTNPTSNDLTKGIQNLHLEYVKEGNKTCTFNYNSGRVNKFTSDVIDEKTNELKVQTINLRSGYSYVSGSVWANHIN